MIPARDKCILFWSSQFFGDINPKIAPYYLHVLYIRLFPNIKYSHQLA